MMTRTIVAAAAAALLIPAAALAGGTGYHDPCCPRVNPRQVLAESRAAVARSLEADAAIEDALHRMSTRWSKQVTVPPAVPNEWGDPMYTAYGPRAYAGSPLYHGPAYSASFERAHAGYVNPSSMQLSVQRGRYYQPALTTRSDQGMLPGASHSYLGPAMYKNPGSVGPTRGRALGGY